MRTALLLALAAAAIPMTVSAAIAQGGHPAASIDQVPATAAASSRTGVAVAPVDASRGSATVPPPVPAQEGQGLTPEQLAACRDARVRGRPGPNGVDCVQATATAVAATNPPPRRAGPTAESALLGMLGESFDTGAAPAANTDAASADQVARQLSTAEFEGVVASDAAASIARDRAGSAPPPATTPPPR